MYAKFTPVILLFAIFSRSKAMDYTQKVDILVFYQHPESLVTFQLALDYISEHKDYVTKVGNVYKIHANYTNIEDGLKQICQQVRNVLGTKQWKGPALDLTHSGPPADVVKLLGKEMGLDMVSVSFGMENDFRALRDCKRTRLIHVPPPTFVMLPMMQTFVLRTVLNKEVITQTTIFYENDALSSSLNFSNYSITLKKLSNNSKSVEHQIQNLQNQEIVFLVSPQRASDLISNVKILDNWTIFSLVRGEIKCTNCSRNVTVTHLFPKTTRISENTTGLNYLAKKLGKEEIDISTAFYFDITLNTIRAFAKFSGSGFTDSIRNCSGHSNSTLAVDNKSKFLEDFISESYQNLIEFLEKPHCFMADFCMESVKLFFDPNLEQPMSVDIHRGLRSIFV